MQSSSQITTTNKPTTSFFTGRMLFLSPNQQCQSTEGKISHSMDLITPSSPGGLPTLSLTTIVPGYLNNNNNNNNNTTQFIECSNVHNVSIRAPNNFRCSNYVDNTTTTTMFEAAYQHPGHQSGQHIGHQSYQHPGHQSGQHIGRHK